MKKIRFVKNSTQQIREAFGLSQQDLAVFLGVSRSTISMAESRQLQLPTGALLQLGRLAAGFHNSSRQPAPVDAKEAAALQAALKKHAQECHWQLVQAQKKLTVLQEKHQQCTSAVQALQTLLSEAEPATKTTDKERLWLQVQQRRLQKQLKRCGLLPQTLLQLKITALEAEATGCAAQLTRLGGG